MLSPPAVTSVLSQLPFPTCQTNTSHQVVLPLGGSSLSSGSCFLCWTLSLHRNPSSPAWEPTTCMGSLSSEGMLLTQLSPLCNTISPHFLCLATLNGYFFFFNFTILYWFCHLSKWIHHRYTCVPHPEPSSLLPPHTIPLGCPRAPAPSIQYRVFKKGKVIFVWILF